MGTKTNKTRHGKHKDDTKCQFRTGTQVKICYHGICRLALVANVRNLTDGSVHIGFRWDSHDGIPARLHSTTSSPIAPISVVEASGKSYLEQETGRGTGRIAIAKTTLKTVLEFLADAKSSRRFVSEIQSDGVTVRFYKSDSSFDITTEAVRLFGVGSVWQGDVAKKTANSSQRRA